MHLGISRTHNLERAKPTQSLVAGRLSRAGCAVSACEPSSSTGQPHDDASRTLLRPSGTPLSHRRYCPRCSRGKDLDDAGWQQPQQRPARGCAAGWLRRRNIQSAAAAACMHACMHKRRHNGGRRQGSRSVRAEPAAGVAASLRTSRPGEADGSDCPAALCGRKRRQFNGGQCGWLASAAVRALRSITALV